MHVKMQTVCHMTVKVREATHGLTGSVWLSQLCFHCWCWWHIGLGCSAVGKLITLSKRHVALTGIQEVSKYICRQWNSYWSMVTKLDSGLSHTCLAKLAEVFWISVCMWQTPWERQSLRLMIYWWQYDRCEWVDCVLQWPIQLIMVWPLSPLSKCVDVWLNSESVCSCSLGLILFSDCVWMCDLAQRVFTDAHLAPFSSQWVCGCDLAQRVFAHAHLASCSSQWVRGCVIQLRVCLLMLTWPPSLLSWCVDVWFSLESVFSWSLGLILFSVGAWMCDSAQRVSSHDYLVSFSSQTVRGSVSSESVFSCSLGLILFSVGAWMCDSAQSVSSHHHLVSFSSQTVSGCVIQLRECLLMLTWPPSLLSGCVHVGFSSESVFSCSLGLILFSGSAWMCDSAQRVSAHAHLVSFSSQTVCGYVI
jgi:hypothetical protein